MNFAERLKMVLEYNHVTQRQLAKDIEVSTSTISRWCNGKGLPDVGELEKICHTLFIQPTYFMGSEPLLEKLLQKYSDGLIK